ncbi:MAG TPA: hypothetical protein VFH90_08275 [Candidatus Limnocylindria bacterium]|nr:hypothetical protein [Candidatus Limnocylindria bacterium]
MQDLAFVIAGWGVIIGGLAAYAVLLLKRLSLARRVSIGIRQQAESAPPPDRPA